MRIAYVIDCRPNFVEKAPVISELHRRIPDGHHVLIHAGQRYDRLMSDISFEDLGIQQPNPMRRVGSARHAIRASSGVLAQSDEHACWPYAVAVLGAA
jgi:UDP-N-acetylglucosamine 2-epimerase (non-hydrolysing)